MEILLSSLDTLEGAFTGALPILDKDGKPTTAIDESGVCVLVHCRMGISRSASVVLAYLLKHHRHLCPTLRDSITFLRTRRFCINPNRGFRAQLEILADVGFDRDLVRDLGLLELGQTLENVYDPEEETLAEERRRKGGSSSSSSAEKKRRKWEDLVRSWDNNPSEWMKWRLDVKGDGEEEKEKDRVDQEATLRECVKYAEGVARQARRWKRMQQAALGDTYDTADTKPPPSSVPSLSATHPIPPINLTTATTPARIRQLLLLPSQPASLSGDLTTTLTHLGGTLELAISSQSLPLPTPVPDDAMDLDVDDDDDGTADTTEKRNAQEFVMQDPRGKKASLIQAEHVAEMEEREKLVEEQVWREAAATEAAGAGTRAEEGKEKGREKERKEDIDGDVNMG